MCRCVVCLSYTDLQQLVGQCRTSADQVQDGVEGVPNFSPEKTEKAITFVELNDEGLDMIYIYIYMHGGGLGHTHLHTGSCTSYVCIGHVSMDSGIGHALLESPCIPLPLSPLTPTPLLRDHLSHLDPIPISPEMADMFVMLTTSSLIFRAPIF